MKKLLIIVPIVVVVAAATVLGLFAAGVFGKKINEPVAYAVEAAQSEPGVFKGLGVDTYFDIYADRNPSYSLDNYVIIRDNMGNKVPLKSTRQQGDVYRITARDGFKPRASYQIWATGATFVAEQYKNLNTFIFMTTGEEKEEVTVKSSIKETALAGTTVKLEEKTSVEDPDRYTITLAEAAENRYQAGDVILAKKPAKGIFSEELAPLYTGDIPGYEYNGMAAYYVLRTSEVVDGREEIYCRLAEINEVFDKVDIYKTLTIDENNFSVNEEMLQQALDQSDFTAAVYEAAQEAFDLLSGSFEKTVKDSPKMVAKFEYDVSLDKIQLDFYFIITLAKGMDVVFAVKNTIYITPNVNFDYDIDGTDLDLQLDLGVNLKTTTVCTIDMETSDAKIQAKDIEDFKKKFKDIVSGKTAEKGIVGAELPIYSYKYPIYCFVLGIEFGVDIDLGIKAQIAFEYDYNTDITVGVTYVNDEFNTYKSIETSSTAKDLVLLGKIRAEAGVYVKITASLLEVAGVGFKIRTGAYAELGGQIRLDMKAALEDKTLHIMRGYYITGGLYLALGFEVKAGFTIPVIDKFVGWDKYWEPAKWEFPLFEYGSKYVVQSLVDKDTTVEVQGRVAEIKSIKVNAFDLYEVKDAEGIEVGLDAFDIEYLDGAENYITIEDGLVKVNPAVGTEFNAKIRITAKSDNYVTGTITFHKAAVMPTCEVTALNFDKKNPDDLTFDVKVNQSTFIKMTGEGIAENYFNVASDGAVTIVKDFLSDLTVGEHVFTYVTDKGRVYLTVNVIDSTPITTNKTMGTFLKSGKSNVVFNLQLSGSKVIEVEGAEKGEYSVDSAGVLVFYGIYLMSKEDGVYDYVVKASNGSSVALAITVSDDRLPELLTTDFTFGKNSGVKSDVVVPFVSYGYALSAVAGEGIQRTNYAVAQDSVTIKKEFLSTLGQGNRTFTLTFSNGEQTSRRSVTVKVVDSATIIAAVSTATFDLNDPKDAEFTVLYTTPSITLTGPGLSASSYSVSSASVVLFKSYLKNLAVGEYDFVATASTSTAALKLYVVDTSVPEIEQAEGGVMTINYDKASSGARFFEMSLAGAAFDKLDGNGITSDCYTVAQEAATGTTKITLKADYLDSLRVGSYEYSVLTGVNVSTLVVNVTDSRKPEAVSETSLTYQLGTQETRTVTFGNYEHGLKTISVKGGGDISIYSGDCDFDRISGAFTLNASYLETLPANTYVTLLLTFDDAAATTLSVTIAVGGANA